MSQFQITKQFVSGPLTGLTLTESTSVFLPIGFTGPNYVVIGLAEAVNA